MVVLVPRPHRGVHRGEEKRRNCSPKHKHKCHSQILIFPLPLDFFIWIESLIIKSFFFDSNSNSNSMESSSYLRFFPALKPQYQSSHNTRLNMNMRPLMEVKVSASYQKFIHFALDETKLHTHLLPSPLQVPPLSLVYFMRLICQLYYLQIGS